jgi:hypothetical protein
MADGELILTVEEGLARKLRQAADAAGEPVELYARHALEAFTQNDWTEAFASLEEYDRTGACVGLEEALGEFERKIEEGLAKR